jgi:hypothetical protein
MRRLGALVVLCATLAACQDAPTPPSESFQFPLAVFIQGKPNDFWDAVLSGMRTRLDLPGVQLETVFFTAAEREDIARRIVEGDWRTVAFCAPNDAWAKQTVEQTVLAGAPVVLVGADLPNTTRLGYVGTYYYDARLVPLSDSRNAPSVIQKLASEPRVQGIFLMGAEVAQQGIGVAPRRNIGVLSWRESAKDWYLARQIDLLILERPDEIGVRAANLMRNLSQGRGGDLQIVYVPYEWRAR